VIRHPKLLFLAWPFPPLQASGSVRTWNIAKHLARIGWDVTVVTPHPSLWLPIEDQEKVTVEVEQERIQRIFTGHRWRCLSPAHLNCWNRGVGRLAAGVCRKIALHLGLDSGIGWIREAERACSTLTEGDVDVILASGPPFAGFTLAKRLSDRWGRPYVLDYRDPWLGQASGRHSVQVIRTTEKPLIQSCSAVTAVSKSLLNGNADVAPKLHVITNGFDPEELAQIQPYDFGHFAIVYTGIFYPPKRVITPVMGALRRLKDSGMSQSVQWRFHYYGSQGDHVCTEAERFGVRDKIEVHGRVTRAQALSAIRGSGVAVVVTSVLEEKAVEDKGIVTGKLFEPLGLKVPVLLIGPSGCDLEAIVENAGLVRMVTANDMDGIASFLTEVMSGRVPKAKNPEIYAWTNIVRKLDVVLRDVITNKAEADVGRAKAMGDTGGTEGVHRRPRAIEAVRERPSSITIMSTCSEEVDDGKRFEFGKNWSRFLSVLNEERIIAAERSLRRKLDCENLTGRSFLDVGSGSGLYSLAARRLGARVHSFDFDPQSVACTLELKRRYFPDDVNWTIEQGSILDLEYIKSLSQFGIVYSWGVLHHTGAMWQALDNVRVPIAVGGILWLALYNDQGLTSKWWKKVKQTYCSGTLGKLSTIGVCVPYFVLAGLVYDVLKRKNPLRRYREYKNVRGMSMLTDWLDWLGGYPFEVARPEEIVELFRASGFELRKFTSCGGSHGNNQFVFGQIESNSP